MPVQRKGIRALELWCKRVTAGYPNVDVVDLSSSFRDGMAFCAIIHHFRPDLLSFDGLNPNEMLKNNELAFQIAEEKLGIPALLDAEDMLATRTPDKFSISTYLAQFYHVFKNDDPDAGTGEAKPRLPGGSESSETNSSADCTPVGTPVLASKARAFDPADLIAKYGEDIFSKSPLARENVSVSPSAPPRVSSSVRSPSVASVCKAFELRARVSDAKPGHT